MSLINAIEDLFPNHNFKWERHGPCAKGLCPLHHNSHTPAFAIYVDAKGREKWHCFTEDIGGNLLDLVRLSGVPGTDTLGGATQWLLKKGYFQETEQQKADRERNEALCKFYKWTNSLLCTSENAKGVRAYLAGRRVSVDTLDRAAVGYYPSLKRVKEWLVENDLVEKLESEVCVPESEALRVMGSLIFFYKTSYSEISRLKIRNVTTEKDKEKNTFFLGTKSKKNSKIGYFSWWFEGIAPSNAIIVEGEFDVAALATMVYKSDPEKREPIYCFSGGSNMAPSLDTLTDMGIENIYIFPDNDEPGINYAAGIAENFPDTYSIFPKNYQQGEDPAEWAGNHAYSDLEEAFANRIPAFMWVGQKLAERYINATIEEQASIKAKIIEYGRKLSATNRESFIKAFGSLAGVSLDSIMQEIEESSQTTFRKSLKPETFGIWYNAGRTKVPEWRQISNVIIEHIQDVVLDDFSGVENIQRNITLRVLSVNATKELRIPLSDFIDDKKFRQALTNCLGSAEVLIEPRMEAQLRNSMVVLGAQGNPTNKFAPGSESIVYLHTGWRDGRYYTTNGYIDGDGFHNLDDISVELPDNPPYFKNYHLAEPPADMDIAKNFIRNEVLQVFPYEITLPYLAHIFWTVIAEFLPMAKPYCLWVVGQTGSFKTSYTGVMASFFGDFKTADFETWRSTVNAIEQNGYYLKDSPFILDDYKAVDIKKEDVTRCIQNYADRHGRGRMVRGKGSIQERTYYIRGNMIVTAEDVPPEGETSIPARTLELRVPTTGDPIRLTNSQIGVNMLPGVMSKFIQFLINKHLNSADYERLLSERRQQFKALHARTKENLAANSIAWDLVAEFFGFEDLTPMYHQGISNILERMNAATKSQQAGEVFVESISTLIASGMYFLEGINDYESTPHMEGAKRLGWIDEKGCYLIGQEALAEVNTLRMKSTGSPMNYTLRTVYDQLIAFRRIIPDAAGKPTKNKRINGYQIKIIEFRRGVIEKADETFRDKIEPKTAVVRDARAD